MRKQLPAIQHHATICNSSKYSNPKKDAFQIISITSRGSPRSNSKFLPSHQGRSSASFGLDVRWRDDTSWMFGIWRFPKMNVSKNGWFIIKIPFKWMIGGYPYFRKPPYHEESRNAKSDNDADFRMLHRKEQEQLLGLLCIWKRKSSSTRLRKNHFMYGDHLPALPCCTCWIQNPTNCHTSLQISSKIIKSSSNTIEYHKISIHI